MMTELTKTKINGKMDKNDPANTVRKYGTIAFDHCSAF